MSKQPAAQAGGGPAGTRRAWAGDIGGPEGGLPGARRGPFVMGGVLGVVWAIQVVDGATR